MGHRMHEMIYRIRTVRTKDANESIQKHELKDFSMFKGYNHS